MSIRMPLYSELSDEQLSILEDTDLDSNLLVVGPPGTGKTVIAMWRAKQVCSGEDIENATIIMYNVVLSAYSNQWEDQHPDVIVSTYHKWVWNLWKEKFGSRPPKKIEDNWQFDWAKIASALLKSGHGIGHLIVDEAQDLPTDFFSAMGIVTSQTSSSTVCVVADENQKLDAKVNSSISEIKEPLSGMNPLPTSLLKRNYRNTKEIAALSSCFYTGVASEIADPPSRSGAKPSIVAYNDLDGMVEAIGKYARNHPKHSVLVIADSSLRECFAKLTRSLEDASGHMVEGYKRYAQKRGERLKKKDKMLKSCLHTYPQLNTSKPGTITCVHWKSMKGLEADAVFVPEFETHNMGNDGLDAEMMRMYVMFSRARLYLEVQYRKTTDSNDRMLALVRERAATAIEWRTK